jgi:hypothetical protein
MKMIQENQQTTKQIISKEDGMQKTKYNYPLETYQLPESSKQII